MSNTGPFAASRPPATRGRLGKILSLEDFEEAARRHLPRPIFGYIQGGTETDSSVRANRASFAAHAFVPRVLVDTGARSGATMLMGQACAQPFGISPMGASALAAYRGDMVLTEAARDAGIPMIVSGASLIRMEDLVAANPDAWFQAYLPGEEDRILPVVDRAAAAGFKTLVLTADTAVLPNRENNVRSGFSMPLKPTPRLAWDSAIRPRWLLGTFARTLMTHGMPHIENMDAVRGVPLVSRNFVRALGARDRLTWAHFAMMRRRWPGKIVVKGILAAEDARRAADEGADGIIVSNHGGRQLDFSVAPLQVLPEIVAAAGEMPVMLDGGVRRGTDVLKALALGAKFVWVGRPMIYAAAIGGQPGVAHAISLLAEEVRRGMALLGAPTLDDLGPHLLRPAV
ncbi:L-lactate dehydrogenase (cytochrome) [Humitalea rosea]|uniref:L-lactate dehydrogenase (Cytochrome) n=1 Tax=Humitalea rosea TaxID=990373 RepID=A0A2W7IIN8_9PROT|nr:alpha-hydroxy acid oxidase [Humitalea rosea]PZW45039.1 L-lactate dehydrogenase (cytochrome) [Humitalea rosea]